MHLKTLLFALVAVGLAIVSATDIFNNTLAGLGDGAAVLQKRAHDGIASVYYKGGATGSCGHIHKDSDHVVSIDQYWYDRYGKGFLCGRRIRMKNIGHATDHSVGGKGNVVIAKIVDTCSGCDETHLDISKGSWSALTNGHGDSVVRIHWYFCGLGGEC